LNQLIVVKRKTMKKIACPLFLTVFLWTACRNTESSAVAADSTDVTRSVAVSDSPAAVAPDTVSSLPTGDNSMTSVDWDGTYMGVLPCADCEGIATSITLKKDKSYTMVARYLGKKGSPVKENRGNFSWNEAGSIITLEGITGGGSNQYQVGENQLFHLDREGKRITGELAQHYVLKKQTDK
jgi:uncharacterized lipoprotein NlpE involved in copper resistance